MQLIERNITSVKIEKLQKKLLKEEYDRSSKNVIVFFSPGFDIVNGGILSINSLCHESKKLKNIHNSEVIMCNIPGDPPLLKYTKFKNSNFIFQLKHVLFYFKNLENLVINIPEYKIYQVVIVFGKERIFEKLKKIKNVHFNIMLQNIDLMNQKNILALKKLKEYGKVSCTTAHERYSSTEYSEKLQLPLYFLGTNGDPMFFYQRDYLQKEDKIIVSPDFHPYKEKIINLISANFPKLKINIINNITFEEYKELISKAKWALTFGEGLDGYFTETIFSGGISFAVYNERFFMEDYKTLRTVYKDYDEMVKNICNDIKELDKEINYKEYHKKQLSVTLKFHSYNKFLKRLENFYKNNFNFEN